MIEPVDKYIESFANAGADIITFHPEATPNIENTINLIKKTILKKLVFHLNQNQKLN